LAASPYADAFVLKGGMLLAVFDARRPTEDMDLLAQRLANDEVAVVTRVREIARVPLPDGVKFVPETMIARSTRDDATYAGVRVTMNCHISSAVVKMALDINFGDPVTPEPRRVELPSQRPGEAPVKVWGYPVETVIAEKACTAVQLGEANTRVRDYADIYTLIDRCRVSYRDLRAALEATAMYRQMDLKPLSSAIKSFSVIRQSAYLAFRTRLGADGIHLPPDLAVVASAVVAFVDPVLTGQAVGRVWSPTERAWRE
jgi:hypothetical protein